MRMNRRWLWSWTASGQRRGGEYRHQLPGHRDRLPGRPTRGQAAAEAGVDQRSRPGRGCRRRLDGSHPPGICRCHPHLLPRPVVEAKAPPSACIYGSLCGSVLSSTQTGRSAALLDRRGRVLPRDRGPDGASRLLQDAPVARGAAGDARPRLPDQLRTEEAAGGRDNLSGTLATNILIPTGDLPT